MVVLGLGLAAAPPVAAGALPGGRAAPTTSVAMPAGSAPALANPAANQAPPLLGYSTGQCAIGAKGTTCPSPCHPTGAFGYDASAACTALYLKSIDAAQLSEKRRPLTLPSDYGRLSATRQLFVLVDLERVSRGVPPLAGLSPYLSAEATDAARQGGDPAFQQSYGAVRVWAPPNGGPYAFGGAWAGDSVNAAAAVFGWFYDDGWGGAGRTWNGACTSPTAQGCWGHRDELLGEWAGTGCTDCVAGAGYAGPAQGNWLESFTFLLVRPVHYPTPLAFSWDRDVVPYLPAGWERAVAPTA